MIEAFKEIAPVEYGEHGIWFRQSRHVPDGKCFPAHWHNRVELLHIVAGSLFVQLGEKDVEVREGEMILIMPYMVHGGVTGPEGLVCNMIAFDIDLFMNQTSGAAKYLLPILRHEICFHSVTSKGEIIDVAERIAETIVTKKECNPLRLQAGIYELVGLFYQYCVEEQGTQVRMDERFDQVLHYIEEHFTEGISTGSLSRQFGYDEAYFCRRFKGITGITAKKYIRILRLEKAQRLLLSSREEIKVVASQCGFLESSYFTNCFKKHFGVTPQEYRKG